jgi:hypothetical protein
MPKVGSSLARDYKTTVGVNGTGKHSSLLRCDGCKKIIVHISGSSRVQLLLYYYTSAITAVKSFVADVPGGSAGTEFPFFRPEFFPD